ncbi:hypothetical protein DVH24_039621 [Malus domestica]|uniref:Uncharacterized protein n=1 Tax=Malus domestica TaxID=3750 RepID=A0A498I391_MALDO|nr:hypothetical protein DVH24_039621 [Malus domestica]
MSLTTGVPKGSSWQPNMTADTTTPSYWLNWRVLLCTVWISIALTLSVFVVCKYEARRGISNRGSSGETQQQTPAGALFEDETWRPCLKGIHPAWLLAFRVFAFFVLLILLIVTAFVDGGSIFLFYTQWTFTLITIYFGLGSLLSIRGCYRYHKKTAGDRVDSFEVDTEQGSTRATPSHVVSCSTSTTEKSSAPHVEQPQPRQPAGFSGYVFQIIFQMNAGAVLLTDFVFWFILVPFLAIKDYNLNFFIINMHSINAVFLLGDTALNSLVSCPSQLKFPIHCRVRVSTLSLVPNWVFLPVDSLLRSFPVALPCLCQVLVNSSSLWFPILQTIFVISLHHKLLLVVTIFASQKQVAVSISRLVIAICSGVVLVRRSTAHPMLQHFCSDNEAQTPSVFDVVA